MFWLISAPNREGQDIFEQVNQKTAKESNCSENKKFATPSLRVGTLNSLIALNDDLHRLDTFMENTAKKLAKQLGDLAGTKPKDKSLSIDGSPIQNYLSSFKWDDGKYSLKLTLQEIVDKLTTYTTKIDEELKTRAGEYSSLSSSLAAEERKTSGNLTVRSIQDLIPPEVLIQSEYITTAFVVIPKSQEKDFLQAYETLSEYVVARSAKRLATDPDFFLYSVFLFKKYYDNFKHKVNEKKWVIREFKADNAADLNKSSQETQKLTESKKNYKASFQRWCKISFPEAFTCWIHLKVIRLFVESVLRFGIPFNFQAILMRPHKPDDKNLRDILYNQFKYLGSAHISGKNELEEGEKFFPYVYIPIDCEM